MILMYDRFEVTKVLVIAPLRVAKNTWPNEIVKFEEVNGLTYSVVTGSANERKKALERKADIYIINRENLPWLVEKSGEPFDFDMIVIDELSSFKNWESKRFRALMKVRPRAESKTNCGPYRNAIFQRTDGSLCRVQGPGYGKAFGEVHQPVPDQLLQAGSDERTGGIHLQTASLGGEGNL